MVDHAADGTPMAAHMASVSMSTPGDRAAIWHALRSMGEVFEAQGETWMLTSPDAVAFAHRHPELLANGGVMDVHDLPIRTIPGSIDPPEHHRFRHILDPMSAPRVINAIEDELRVALRDLVREVTAKGCCDVVHELARCYPTDVFRARVVPTPTS